MKLRKLLVLAGAVMLTLTLRAQTPPTIASISNSQTVFEGQNVSFTTSINGTPPFSYQWSKDGASIPGATNGGLTFNPVRVSDAGSYTVVVTNAAGFVKSDPILLAVTPATAPTINFTPNNQTITIGDTLSFSISVSGNSPFTYDWKRNGVLVATTTTNTYIKSNAQTSDAGSYTVTVTNIGGSTTSSAFTVTVNPPTTPVISSVSSSRTVNLNDSLNLSVNATGSGTLSYQWNKNGVPVQGGTSSSYFLSFVLATDAGTYTVTVTNNVGSVTSSAIVVTVTTPTVTAPTIFGISNPVTVAVGDNFTLSASINGSSPLTYQWRKDGVAIAGATSSNYGRTGATSADVGTYSVTATNSGGSTTSSSTTVAVSSPQLPIIVRQPVSQIVNPGDSAFLSVSATPSNLSYQWRRNGTPIAGNNSSSYSFSTSATTPTDSYTVLVSNAQGAALSEPAVIGVAAPTLPVISFDPVSQSVRQGETLNLQAGASGTLAATYQWRKDGVAIAGATFSNYSKSNLAASDAGAYTLAVTNSAGTTISATATITVLPAALPVITRQPGSFSLLPGETSFNLAVQTRGTSAPTTFQWRKDGVALTGGGATDTTFVISNAQPAAAGTYTVVVTNAAGSVTSAPAVVTVDLARPVITSTSGGVAGAVGDSLFLQVNTSVNNPAVQWRKDGAVVPNATTTTLSLNNFSAASAGSYVATVTPTGGTPVDSRPITVSVLDLGVAPLILRPPASQTRTLGSSANFDVSVEGERPFTFQWRKDGADIPGATSQSYFLSTLVAANAGNYSVVVTNRNGAATSANALLTVSSAGTTTPPVIRVQPASQVLFINGSFGGSLSVTPVNSNGVSYQWRKNGVAINSGNGTSSSFSISPVLSDAGRYSVVLTNAAGSVTSNEVSVTVVEQPAPPRFGTQPQTQSVLPGTTVIFTAAATGTSTPTYQWRKNGADISGATDTTLTLTNVQAVDAATYSVIATTPDGVASSTPATLTIQTPTAGLPVITQQPKGGTIFPSGSFTLTVGVAGNPTPTYQWFKNGAAISGATGLSLALTGPAGVGSYSISATNSFGSVASSLVSVGLGNTITFSSLPPSQTVAAGTAVTLSAAAQSTSAITYQWRKNGVAIAGATGATLSFAIVKPADAGSYTLVATTSDGSVESSPISLNVATSPFAGVYLGTFSNGDAFALNVGSDGAGALIGFLVAQNQAVIAHDFFVSPTGAFATTAGTTSRFASFVYSGAITGSISGGTVSGGLSSAGISFSGALRSSVGPAAAVVGYYQGVALAATLGEMHAIALADGTLQLVALDPSGVRSARGQVSASGAFSVVQPQFTYTGNVGVSGSSLTGTYQLAGGPTISLAAPAAADGVERLANVSTRTLAGSGARTLIAGFAINGTTPKDVLVRASGPALAVFNVPGTLPNPRLRIFKGATALFENDDWSIGGSASQISTAAARLGAFPFAIGSADAALLVRLDPGSYTAQVTSDADVSGVALVEVYDASTSSTGLQKLINVSTRSDVGIGGDILIVGVIVSGNAPKKLLIRGIGPTLAAFQLTGLLATPRLQLFRGSQLLRENIGWSTGSDAALISSAAAQVGAFALPNGSADCAMLVYLAPGSYTAQVSGVNNTTGVALVEVYEVP